MDEDSKQWLNLYEDMSDGKVDYNSKFYTTNPPPPSDEQDGHGAIPLVTPTKAQVDQAKVQVKRKLSLVKKPAAAKKRKTSTYKKRGQAGGSGKTKKRPALRGKAKKSGQRGGKKVVRKKARKIKVGSKARKKAVRSKKGRK